MPPHLPSAPPPGPSGTVPKAPGQPPVRDLFDSRLGTIVTILVASQLVGESVTWMFAAGAAIVLAAVYVGAVRRPPRESSTTASTAKPPDEAAARTD